MKFFIPMILLSALLFSDSFSTRYDVNVGMFGKVGYADIQLQESDNTYEMKLVATLIGTAANLTGNRTETYISRGKIINGKYLPDSFVKIKKNNHKERVQTYTFDHLHKKVTLEENNTQWVSETTFDTKTLKLVKKSVQEHTNHSADLNVYYDQDLLSAYLNTQNSCNADNKKHNLFAVGAHNEDKRITLSFLEGKTKQESAQHFIKDASHLYNLSVIPTDEDEARVDVLISLDNDGLVKEAYLGDIFWIGKINATRVYHQVSSN